MADHKVNAVTVTYLDADNNVETKTASVPVTLTEPLLIIEKSVSPTGVLRGSTTSSTRLTLYHSHRPRPYPRTML